MKARNNDRVETIWLDFLPVKTLTLSVPTGSISGEVREIDGVTAIPGATIEALLGDSVIASTTTATDGTYQLINLPASPSGGSTGTYDLQASKNDYVIKQVSGVVVIEKSTTTVNFILEEGARATVPPDQEKIITISSGTAEEIKLEISSGTFASTTTVTVTRKTDLVTPDMLKQPNFKGTGIGIEIDASTQPLKPIIITLKYTDAQVQGLQEENLVLARYDSIRDEWVVLSSTVNPATNTITATITGFSIFQIVQVTTRPRSGETVTVYHGVFNPAAGEKVGIAYTLSEAGQVRISIYDSLGREIKGVISEYKSIGSYLDWWNGKNDSGEIVASGVYLIYLEAPEIKVMKKVVVVK